MQLYINFKAPWSSEKIGAPGNFRGGELIFKSKIGNGRGAGAGGEAA